MTTEMSGFSAVSYGSKVRGMLNERMVLSMIGPVSGDVGDGARCSSLSRVFYQVSGWLH